MNPEPPPTQRRRELTIFDLAWFMAVVVVTHPFAKMASSHFEGHWRSMVFYFVLIVGCPVLGFGSQILFWRIVIFCRRGRHLHEDHKPDA